MLTALMALTLAAAPVKVAVPGFNFVGIDKQLGEVFLDRFVNVIAQAGELAITTSADVQQVLGLERQRQLLGCSDSGGACLAELAGALGVDTILVGSLAKSGNNYTVNLRVLKAGDGKPLVAATERVTSETALQDWLDAQARSLPQRLRAALGIPETVVVKPAEPAAAPVVRWIPGIVGVAAAGTGALLFALSKGDAEALRRGGFSSADAIDTTVASGQLKETSGLILMVGGGAAVAASVVWALVAPKSDVQVAIVPTSQGAVVGFSGTLP